jgi:hypothetical protein
VFEVGGEIEVVRGRLDDRAGQVLAFLSGEGGLNEEAARRRLSETICVALDDGEVIGVNSAHQAGLTLIGGRRFWIYASTLKPDSEELWGRMFDSAFGVLAGEFDDAPDAPVGVCALIDDPARMASRAEAIWPDTELMFAGYLDDGRQVRLRYFWGASIGPGYPDSPSIDESRVSEYPLAEGYRIRPVSEEGPVTPDDVLRLWEREGAVPQEEARRRVGEVKLVGIGPGGEVAGVSSLFIRHNPQLRMDLWYYRTYVARDHRHSGLAAQLIFRNRDLMDQRYVSGADRTTEGMVFELENEGMRKYFNKALWLPAQFTFIGERENGAHVRVHYFPGARVPTSPPPPAR